jgi:CO/xanthine dehydrogenase Mo-binding subunit
MSQFIGKPIPRSEDARLLTGQALFVDDVHLPNMAFVAFLRSPYAHARITGIDTSAAEALDGVIAVHTAESLGDYWKQGPFLVSPPPIERLTFHERTQPILAKDKARHVGEPLAAVVAESRYIAEDALQRIVVNYEPLPAVVDLEAALETETVPVHEDLESNVASHAIQEIGDYESIREKADVVIRRRFTYDHGTAAAMENRGIVADWNAKAQRMTMWDTTQAPIPIRNGLAGMLGLSEHQVRVIAPFIGGGFGPKIMMFYPEEMLLPWLSMRYNRPMKWIEDRVENFVGTTNERSQIHEAEIAMTKDGMILGVHDNFIHDTGAYDPYGLTVPINSQCTLLGCYDIPNYYSEFNMVFTNKTLVTPYRGAGRQHGVFVMEFDAAIWSRQMLSPRIIRSSTRISPH